MSEASVMESNFPSLNVTPRRYGIPRRYEETRPVIVQDFTHRRILGVGQEIHRRTIQRIDVEKQLAIRQAEEAVWEQAEEVKAKAIEKVWAEARTEQEKIMKKMFKDMGKKLKEEGLRVEMLMQKLAIEQVKQERTNGEAQLKEAVKKVEEKAKVDLQAAVVAVRTEETKKTAEIVAKHKKKHASEIENVKKEAEKEKERVLKALLETKQKEAEIAVSEAHTKEGQIAAYKLEKMKNHYEQEIEKFKIEMDDKNSEIEELHREIEKVEKSKEKVEECLVETRKEFQMLVKRLGGFNEEQANLLMPPLYLDEIEKLS